MGRRLAVYLADAGWDVWRLVRAAELVGPHAVWWDPATGQIRADLEPADAIVHLAGENIAGGRWTAARKRLIFDSRVGTTERLCRELAGSARRPGVLIAASAIGYYGDRGDELLTEASTPGQGFLPEVVQAWERATEPAREAGIRVVNLRLGVVLAGEGGVLGRLRRPFRLGLGGRLGSGRQYLSWIAREDVVRVVEHTLVTPTMAGPVNVVSPEPVTNAGFTRVVAHVLRRSAFLHMPAAVIRLLLGEMGRELLLASTRVRPALLLSGAFPFRFTSLESAVRAELGIGGAGS